MRMTKVLVAVAALIACCASAQALPSWTALAPGGGGNFSCASVSSTGNWLVGSDNSGLYWRTYSGSAWTWKRIGILNGLLSAQIRSVAYDPLNPSRAACAAGNGLFLSTNSGQTWSRESSPESDITDYQAVTWSQVPAESGLVYVAYNKKTTAPATHKLKVYKKDLRTGGSWSSVWSQIGSDTYGDSTEVAVIRVNPHGTTQDHDLLAVTGNVFGGKLSGNYSLQEMWFDRGLTGSPVRYNQVASGNTAAVVSACFSTRNPVGKDLYVAVSNKNPPDNSNDDGRLYRLTGLDNGANCTWTAVTVDSLNRTTGAVWVDGPYVYLLNVAKDACPRSPVPNAFAGIWRADTTQAAAFARFDNGSSWDVGWATQCSNAMGQTIRSAAKSVSEKGGVRVSPSFAYGYETISTGKAYKKLCTTGTEGGSTWNTTLVDNVNPTVMAFDSNGDLWAGFYDIGLWKYSGGVWSDKNYDDGAGDWGDSDHQGGNITSILFDGSDLYVTAAKSSKKVSGQTYYGYALYKLASGTWSKVGFTSNNHYLRSLTKDTSSGRYYISCDGDIYYATSPSGTWTQGTTTGGMMTVRAVGGTIVAGGWKGIYTSTDGGLNWTQRDDLGLSSSCYGETSSLHLETWNGIHDIFYSPGLQDWWATSYMKPDASSSCLSAGDYGILRTWYPTATWTLYKSQVACRGVAVDSCGERIHYTSGSSFSNGTDNDTEINNERGKQTARWANGAGSSLTVVDDVFTGTNASNPTAVADEDYPNPSGGNVAVIEGANNSTVYVAVQGHGLMSETFGVWSCGGGGGGCEDPPCEIENERPGGGGKRARSRAEEHDGPALPRSIYSVAEGQELVRSGKLELYDAAGRRVKAPGPGIYFSVERNKARVVTARRAVIITP